MIKIAPSIFGGKVEYDSYVLSNSCLFTYFFTQYLCHARTSGPHNKSKENNVCYYTSSIDLLIINYFRISHETRFVNILVISLKCLRL